MFKGYLLCSSSLFHYLKTTREERDLHKSSLLKNKQSPSLSLFSYDTCSSHFVIFMTFHCTCFAASRSLPYGWGQNQSQHFRCHFTSAKWKSWIASLQPLTNLFWMQPRMLLATFASRAHCWLKPYLLFTRTCRSFSVRMCSSQSSLNGYWCVSFFLPIKNIAFPVINFMRLLRSLWRAVQCCDVLSCVKNSNPEISDECTDSSEFDLECLLISDSRP